MAVKLGHAANDDPGTTFANQVKVSLYGSWVKPIRAVLRPRNALLAEASARICEACCANDKIGYSQNSRNTLKSKALDAAKVSQLYYITPDHIKGISTNCYADCASFMTFCACCGGANITYNLESGSSNAPTCRTMPKHFTKNFSSNGPYIQLTDKIYFETDNYWQRGDIVISDWGHTMMVLSTGSKAKDLDLSSALTVNTTTTTTTTTGAVTNPQPTNINYKVTVKANGKIKADVPITLSAGSTTKKRKTNDKGTVSLSSPATSCKATVTVPQGYTAKKTVYNLTQKSPTATIELTQVNCYKIKIIDNKGNVKSGVKVTFSPSGAEKKAKATNSQGIVSLSTTATSCSAKLTVPSGYSATKTDYTLSTASVTEIKLTPLITYKVIVKVDNKVKRGITVALTAAGKTTTKSTNADGIVSLSTTATSCTAKIVTPDGYFISSAPKLNASDGYDLKAQTAQVITINLMPQITYKVNVSLDGVAVANSKNFELVFTDSDQTKTIKAKDGTASYISNKSSCTVKIKSVPNNYKIAKEEYTLTKSKNSIDLNLLPLITYTATLTTNNKPKAGIKTIFIVDKASKTLYTNKAKGQASLITTAKKCTLEIPAQTGYNATEIITELNESKPTFSANNSTNLDDGSSLTTPTSAESTWEYFALPPAPSPYSAADAPKKITADGDIEKEPDAIVDEDEDLSVEYEAEPDTSARDEDTQTTLTFYSISVQAYYLLEAYASPISGAVPEDNSARMEISTVQVSVLLGNVTGSSAEMRLKVVEIQDNIESSVASEAIIKQYDWTYVLEELSKYSATTKPKTLDLEKGEFSRTFAGLSADTVYIFKVIATNAKTQTKLPATNLVFKTQQDYPSKVRNLTVTYDDATVLDRTCSISFSAPASWGVSGLNKGYRVFFAINGNVAAYSDVKSTTPYSNKQLKISTLIDNLADVTFGDCIQISVVAGLFKDNNFIYDPATIVSAPPLLLDNAMYFVDKVYINTGSTESFMRTVLYNNLVKR